MGGNLEERGEEVSERLSETSLERDDVQMEDTLDMAREETSHYQVNHLWSKSSGPLLELS